MGLQSTASATSTSPTATVHVRMNGASGGQTIYTVPANRFFKGYIYLNSQTTPAPQINGVEINVSNMNAGYNYEAPLIPVTLIAGTVVKTHSNTSSSYWTYVTGAEYNA